jgi:hypothetical protein
MTLDTGAGAGVGVELVAFGASTAGVAFEVRLVSAADVRVAGARATKATQAVVKVVKAPERTERRTCCFMVRFRLPQRIANAPPLGKPKA